MNRTREYSKIVQTSNIPQELPSRVQSPLSALFLIDKRIKSTLSDITKCKYELFNIRSKINEVQSLCQEIISGINSININYNNNQEEEVYASVFNILRGRVNEYKLEILLFLRKSEKEEKEKQKRRSKFIHHEEEEIKNVNENLLMQEGTVRMRNNSTQREITQQISEIGSIMEEIGIHVSMQEESFKRIDDLMGQSDKLLDSSIYILKRGVEGITGTRKSLIKFFLFWIVLGLLFWMFRR